MNILLPQHPKHGDDRCEPPCLAVAFETGSYYAAWVGLRVSMWTHDSLTPAFPMQELYFLTMTSTYFKAFSRYSGVLARLASYYRRLCFSERCVQAKIWWTWVLYEHGFEKFSPSFISGCCDKIPWQKQFMGDKGLFRSQCQVTDFAGKSNQQELEVTSHIIKTRGRMPAHILSAQLTFFLLHSQSV